MHELAKSLFCSVLFSSVLFLFCFGFSYHSSNGRVALFPLTNYPRVYDAYLIHIDTPNTLYVLFNTFSVNTFFRTCLPFLLFSTLVILKQSYFVRSNSYHLLADFRCLSYRGCRVMDCTRNHLSITYMAYHLKEQICVISAEVLCLGLTLDSNPAIVFEHSIHALGGVAMFGIIGMAAGRRISSR